MKKLLILTCLVFLFSCQPSLAIYVKYSLYVTGAQMVERNSSFANKYENYDQFNAALDTKFKIPIRDSRRFDEAFFDDNDLIVVIVYTMSGLNQYTFSLGGVYEKSGTIFVRIRIQPPQGITQPSFASYSYLIIVDKMNDMPVSLDVTSI